MLLLYSVTIISAMGECDFFTRQAFIILYLPQSPHASRITLPTSQFNCIIIHKTHDTIT